MIPGDLQLFGDFSQATLSKRRTIQPITSALRKANIPYCWGFLTKLLNQQSSLRRARKGNYNTDAKQWKLKGASLESANKGDPSDKKLYAELLLAQEKVNSFSLQEVCCNIEWLNQKCYVFGNSASHLLALKLRGRRAKDRVLHVNTSHGVKVADPVEIANMFAKYNQQLYNLRDDHDTPQLTPARINSCFPSPHWIWRLVCPSISPCRWRKWIKPLTHFQ